MMPLLTIVVLKQGAAPTLLPLLGFFEKLKAGKSIKQEQKDN